MIDRLLTENIMKYLLAVVCALLMGLSPCNSQAVFTNNSPTVDPKPDQNKTTVYVTKTGDKYHSAGCSCLKKSKIPMSLEDAKKKYSACSKCNPPK